MQNAPHSTGNGKLLMSSLLPHKLLENRTFYSVGLLVKSDHCNLDRHKSGHRVCAVECVGLEWDAVTRWSVEQS